MSDNASTYVVFENTLNKNVFWEEVEYGAWVRMALMRNGIPDNCVIKTNFPTQGEAEEYVQKAI